MSQELSKPTIHYLKPLSAPSAWLLPAISWVMRAGIFVLLLSVSACNRDEKLTENKLAKDAAAAPAFESSLVFNDVTLEQADEKGRPLWKVNANQASYSKDNKTAQITNPVGDLFQDGKKVFQVTAKSGEVQEDGRKIFLKGNIIATDIRNGAVLRGNELEWRAKEDLLIVRNKLVGTHKKIDAAATEARYTSRTQQMELLGQVVAVSKDPVLQMRTEHLIWDIPNEKVTSDKRIQIDRYKGKTITDQAAGDKSEVFLKTKVVNLQQNVQLTSSEPPVQISGNSINWNLNTQIVISNQPVSILNRQQQVTLRGNRGQVDLEKRIVVLTNGVEGIGTKNKSHIYSTQLTWNIPTQEFNAEGNVIYQQAKPPLSLTGPRAVGKLQDQTIVVSGGGSGGRVVTEIIP